ncbi:MAG: Iron-sulfur cluster regulator IscR [Ktedonobacterales bacterium]|nr:MAG: Iron-sulfur cluster regulator IscR [Ktedonobacterales bacterium]
MRITMKGDYGLRAMIDLAAHYGAGPVPSGAIAERQRIPEHFLDQLLIMLRRAGLLKSLRGPQGGHMLARPPAQICMNDVIHALEGTIAPMECLPNPGACQLTAGCAIREVWQQVEAYTRQLLLATTLEQLAQRHRIPAQQNEPMYYI